MTPCRNHFSRGLAAVLGLAVIFAAGCGPRADEPQTYVNKAKKFRITFPANWEVRENEMGMDVIGLAPLMGANDQFRDNVYVATSAMEKPLDPDGVLDAIVPSMINTITDFKVETRGKKKIGGADSAFLRYSSRQGKFTLIGTVHALTKGDRAYLVYTIAETHYEPLFKQSFEDVVQSFEALP